MSTFYLQLPHGDGFQLAYDCKEIGFGPSAYSKLSPHPMLTLYVYLEGGRGIPGCLLSAHLWTVGFRCTVVSQRLSAHPPVLP